MNAGLLVIVTVYLAVVSGIAFLAVAGVPCVAALKTGILVAEFLLVIQLIIVGVTLLRGHRPAELLTHLGYANVSVALLPLLTARAGDPPSRADNAVAAMAAAVAIVVTVRLHATWHA